MTSFEPDPAVGARATPDYRAHAGVVRWPASPDDLLGTDRCPACFTGLSTARCGNCGLDLTHPAAARLLELSRSAAATLEQRLDVIGLIRFDTDAAAHPTAPRPVTAAAVSAQAPQARALSAPITASRAGEQAPPPPEHPPPTPPLTPRRFSSVQLVILVAGVSALSVGAVFFLVYAFINYGIVGRSLIIAAITVAAFAAAALLARRGLRSTAEGIAVFTMVLIYLDAFAIRANDFFGAESVDDALYWGAAAVVSGVGFILWHRASGLRSPSIVGFATIAPGAGFTVAGALDQTSADGVAVSFLFLLTTAVVSLVHPFAVHAPRMSRADMGAATGAEPALDDTIDTVSARIPTETGLIERGILLITGWVTLVASLPVAWFIEADVPSVIACLGTAVVAAVHIVVLVRRPRAGARVASAMFSALGALALSTLGVVLAIRIDETAVTYVLPVLMALTVALALEAAHRRLATSHATRTISTATFSAAITAAVVTALALLVPIATALFVSGSVLATALDSAWTLDSTSTLTTRDEMFGFALIALAAVAVLTTAAWSAGGMLARRAPALLWFALLTLAAAVPLLTTAVLIVGGWFALAAACVAGMIATRRRLPLVYRLPLTAVGGVAIALGWVSSAASTSLWALGYGAAIALFVALLFAVAPESHPSLTEAPPSDRPRLTTATEARASTLTTASAFVLGAAATLALLLVSTGEGVPAWTTDATRFVQLAATALLALAALPRLGLTDRRAVFPLALVAAVAAGFIADVGQVGDSRGTVLLPEPLTSLIASALLLVVVIVWAVGRRDLPRPERIAASVALAPVVFLVVDSFVRAVGLVEVAGTLTPITAAMLTAAGGVAITALRRGRGDRLVRLARDAGVGILAVTTVVESVASPGVSTWLVLLLGGVTAMFTAISADGLFGSDERRRHLGWVALGLAIAGLWWRLLDQRTAEIEPFVLPVAGALLLVALLVWRAARGASRVTPLLAFGGLLVAVLPISIVATDGAPLRPLLIGGVSAVLLLAGTLVLGTPALRPYLRVAALAGALGVLITAGGRALVLALDTGRIGGLPFTVEAWLGALLLLFGVAAVGIVRARDDGVERAGRIAAQAALLVAMAVVVIVELLALQVDPSLLRAMMTVLVFAGIHVVAFAVAEPPFTRLVAWTALGCSALTAIAAIGTGTGTAISVDGEPYVELVTVPVALALLASGTLHLAENDRARSWPWLGPGTAALLVPSLLATIDERPLWRLVGLGVVGIAIIVIAVVRRLQAPFLLASAVVVVHAVATFAPQIRAAYEFLPWWLWLVFGGVILIVLAARYEHRVRNVRDVVERVGSLR
ncbi:MAG: hypothetical protein RI885_172 [Actinomycetota bacterium]